MDALAYIKNFYKIFLDEYKPITNAKNIMLGAGYSDMHYNGTASYTNLLFPSNKNFLYKRDFDRTEQTKYIGIDLFSKENTTTKAFSVINKNNILSKQYTEEICQEFHRPIQSEYITQLCSQFKYLTDLTYASHSTHANIRSASKRINLIIVDTTRRRTITTNKFVTVQIGENIFQLKDRFDAIYYLTDRPISIFNPYYKHFFVYVVTFEFENYLNLKPTEGIVTL